MGSEKDAILIRWCDFCGAVRAISTVLLDNLIATEEPCPRCGGTAWNIDPGLTFAINAAGTTPGGSASPE